MNEEDIENNMNAITGEAHAQSEIDWKQKYEHQMEISSADSGRMKKLAAEKAQLEKELAELRASRREEELVSSLSEDERAGIPDDVLKVATKLVNSGMGRMQEENERRFRAMEMARTKESEGNFVSRIDAKYPKFRSSIGPGGDKSAEWNTYLAHNKASVGQAYANRDFDTLAYHIETFYRYFLEAPVPSGVDASAASDPATQGGTQGGRPVQASGRVYTSEEYMALWDQVEAARAKGDWEEKRRLEAEIKNAPSEGRVKDA